MYSLLCHLIQSKCNPSNGTLDPFHDALVVPEVLTTLATKTTTTPNKVTIPSEEVPIHQQPHLQIPYLKEPILVDSY